MGTVRLLFALALLAATSGRAGAFEFEPLDAGSEVSFATVSPRGAQTRAVQRHLPVLRGGTVDGRMTVQGMYERLGDRVYFESRRGAPAEDRSVAVDHPYEIDICFRDADGVPLFASIAGDAPLIPDCEPSRVAEVLAQRPDLQDGFNRSYVAMKRAARLIGKASFAAAFAAEKRELVDPPLRAARHLKRRRPLEALLPGVVIDASPTPGPGGVPTPTDAVASAADTGAAVESPLAVARWKHILGVHTGRAFNVTWFDHTATLAYTAYSFDGGRTSWALFAWENRNHGRHWYEAGMRHKCTYNSAFDRGSSIWRQSCNTRYNATSVWGHNCNDDAVLQIWSVKFNRRYNDVSGYPCNEPNWNLYTPMCFPNG